jgi:hypothetical protein
MFSVETARADPGPPFEAMPDWSAQNCPEDLSFQSFLQHVTLISPRFNTEFVFSVFSSTCGRGPNWSVAKCPATIGRREPYGEGHSWRAKSQANDTAMLRRQANRTGASVAWAARSGSGPCGPAGRSWLCLLRLRAMRPGRGRNEFLHRCSPLSILIFSRPQPPAWTVSSGWTFCVRFP